MNDVLTGVLYGVAVLACVVVVVLLVRDRQAGDRTFVLLGVVELAVVVQLVYGIVALTQTDRDVPGVLFVSYLVGNVCALPIGAFWSLAERSRSGTGVLLVASFTVIALQARLGAIWSGSA